jgi:hypothetical protein
MLLVSNNVQNIKTLYTYVCIKGGWEYFSVILVQQQVLRNIYANGFNA